MIKIVINSMGEKEIMLNAKSSGYNRLISSLKIK